MKTCECGIEYEGPGDACPACVTEAQCRAGTYAGEYNVVSTITLQLLIDDPGVPLGIIRREVSATEGFGMMLLLQDLGLTANRGILEGTLETLSDEMFPGFPNLDIAFSAYATCPHDGREAAIRQSGPMACPLCGRAFKFLLPEDFPGIET